MSDPTIKEFMTGDRDFGTEVLEEALTQEQKKIAALAMGMNAAVVQFINEGVLPIDQQMHFMMHLQDFTARIYAGETIKLPNTHQTLALNSVSGKLFAIAADEALVNGHKNFEAMQELARQAKAEIADDDDKQTTLEQDNAKKPTLH